MRTLGLGLVAVAAVVVSVSLARSRGDSRRDAADAASARAEAIRLDLAALRSAGF